MTTAKPTAGPSNQFTPNLLIGIGATTAFYTLRKTYLHDFVIGGQVHYEVRSHHLRNLSQDLDEALTKAKEASVIDGIPLRAQTRESLIEDMRKIERASADEIAAREAAEQLSEEVRAQYKAAADFRAICVIGQGYIPIGAHAGERLADVPRGYITWLIHNRETFEPGTPMRALAERAIFMHGHRALPQASGKKAGDVGQRLTLTVTVTKAREFSRPVFRAPWRSETVNVTTMIDLATGAECVVFSPSFNGAEGGDITIRGTVKGFKDYEGITQTVLTRCHQIEDRP